MSIDTLLEKNRAWVERHTSEDPEFFRRIAGTHKPRFLYIGCSDARVPVNTLTQTGPGELFVHRNVANQVVPTDANLLAVLHYAVDALGVTDVIVCGHEGCGGVAAALHSGAPLLVEHWLAGIRTTARIHADELDAQPDEKARLRRLVELNVMEQIHNLSRTPVVQAAWERGAELRIHGLVYGLEQGLLRDLHVTMDGSVAAGELRRAG
ncbi:carbonic anhydrase [Longimicrobium sp.]|uniref:carbonic anhydrase n=1 Tax=Longimicrobium sp. TaxID=2029185 RepID=UPI002E37F3F5|nr:carbonic anhydrase [Longimicrobium sp.]HEX6042304.1 carbonic anhydrase [Longimicrobium sp.]